MINIDIKSMIKNKVKESVLDTTIEIIVKEVSTKLKCDIYVDSIIRDAVIVTKQFKVKSKLIK